VIANLLRLIADVYALVLIARVVVSWLPVDPDSTAIRYLYQITEPVLAPIRRVLPVLGGFDFSPLVALLLLEWIKILVVG